MILTTNRQNKRVDFIAKKAGISKDSEQDLAQAYVVYKTPTKQSATQAR